MQTARAKKILSKEFADQIPLSDTTPLPEVAQALGRAEAGAIKLCALGELRTEDLLPAAKTDLQRFVLLRLLPKRPDESAKTLAFLADALSREDAYFIYEGAADILGQIGTTAARELLESAHSRTSNPDVKGAIANALAWFANEKVPDALRDQLKADDDSAREDALSALGRVPSPDATDLLLAALDDPHRPVRETAAEVLSARADSRIAQEIGLRLERAKAAEKSDLVKILAKRGDATALPALLRQLQVSRSKDLHRRILLALGAIGDPKALPALHLAITEGTKLELQNAACHALGKIAAEASIPVLSSVLLQRPFGDGELQGFGDRNLYRSALDALTRIQHDDATDQCIAILDTLHQPGPPLKARRRLEMVSSIARRLGKDRIQPEASLRALEPHLVPELEEIAPQDPLVHSYEATLRSNVDRLRKRLGLPALPTEPDTTSDEAPDTEILSLLEHYNTKAVIKMGARAIPALRRLLAESEGGARPRKPPLYIAKLLQQMDFAPETLRERLAFALANRDFASVRTLGPETPAVLAELFPHLQAEDLQVEVLGVLAELDAPDLGNLFLAIRSEAARITRLRHREEITELLSRLAERQRDEVAAHLANLDSTEESDRAMAEMLLPCMADQIDTAPFCERLQRDDALSMGEAEFICGLLGGSGDVSTIPALAYYLINGNYPAYAVSALRQIGGPEAVLALKPGLKLAGTDRRYAGVPQALEDLGYRDSGDAEAIIRSAEQGAAKDFRKLLASDPEGVAATLSVLPRDRAIRDMMLQNDHPAFIPHRVSAFLETSYHDYRKRNDPLRRRLLEDDPKAVLDAFNQLCKPLGDEGPFENSDRERAMHVVSNMRLREATDFSLEVIAYTALPWKPGFQRPFDSGAVQLAIDHLGKQKVRDAIEPAMTILASRSEPGLLRALMTYLWRVRAVEVLDALKETSLRDDSEKTLKAHGELIQKLEGVAA